MRDDTLTITSSPEEFTAQATDHLAGLIRTAINERGRCTLALSGGSTPGPVYTRLAETPDIDWDKVALLLVDERCVPMTSAESTQGMITDALLKHLPARPARFVVPDTRLEPPLAAEGYAFEVEELLDVDTLDICVLGMGDDGHIASIFPPVDEAALSANTAFHAIQDRFPITDRISLTLPILESSRHPVLLLSGPKKKTTWEEMLASKEGPGRWPFKAILAAGRAAIFARW